MKEVCFDLRLSSHDIKRLSSKVADALMHSPDQDVLHAANGHLLLAAGELDEAQASFETALHSPLCIGTQRGTVLYNLGCVFARKGQTDLCAVRLRESKHFSKLIADEVRKDPDLESVRSEAWFEELLKAE
jgi:Tfp pilus assembly protein PilF